MKVHSAGDGQTRVLLSLLHLWERDGRVTMRQVADGAGLSLTTTKKHLDSLRLEGLVTWDEGTNGTLRPRVAVVR